MDTTDRLFGYNDKGKTNNSECVGFIPYDLSVN